MKARMKIVLKLLLALRLTLVKSELDEAAAVLRRAQDVVKPTPPCCDPLLQPGTNGNNFCFEGSACCPDGTWACSIGDGKTFICGGAEVVNPNGPICSETCCERIDKPCKDVRCCPDGIWTCPNANGSYLCGGVEVSDPAGKPCAPCCDKLFMPFCFIGTAACCPDGNWACPNGDTDVYPCGPVKDPQGTICGETCCNPLLEPGGPIVTELCEFGHICDSKGNWQCLPRPMPTSPTNPTEVIEPSASPTGKICEKPCCDPTLDLRCLIGSPACCPDGQWTCPDGITGLYPCNAVNPSGPFCDNGCCEVESTPDCGTSKPVCCPEGSWTCPAKGGGYVCKDQAFLEPPGGPICNICCPANELKTCLTGNAQCCSDGTWVCPDAASGLYKCGDDVFKELKGKPCEACCDPALKPPGPFPCRGEGLACCPDGTWSCSIGDGKTFVCGGVQVVEPNGKVCNTSSCCNPDKAPICLLGSAGCCPDGSWSCPAGENGPYTCGLTTIDKPNGAVCGCCDPAKAPKGCFEGVACCPDGTWSCSIGDGMSYPCGGSILINPTGKICKCCDPAKEPGKFGNRICREGHACCPHDGSWVCSIGDGKTFPCGNVLVENPTGAACTAVADPGGDTPWTYAVPVWFDDVKNRFNGTNLQKCSRRRFPPKDGSKCGTTAKTCFFGTQTCGGTSSHPEQKCVCDRTGLSGKERGTWRCTPEVCVQS